MTAQALAKFAFFYRPLRVLARAEIQHMFDYVIASHGRKFVTLHE